MKKTNVSLTKFDDLKSAVNNIHAIGAFHAMCEKHVEEIKKVKERYTQKEALEILGDTNLNRTALADTLQIQKGEYFKRSQKVDALIKKYPHEMLAIVLANQGEFIV